MKILMHYSDGEHTPERKRLNTYGAIGYYRIVKPSEQIKGHDVTVMGSGLNQFGTTLQSQWATIFDKYDVFWTGYFADEKVGAAMVFNAQQTGGKIIIDIDDNYLDIPESNNLYERFRKTKRERAMMSTILSFADAITCSTYPLKERLYQHFLSVHGLEKKIYVIPNHNDVSFWKADRPEIPDEPITIGYTGSNSHQDDLVMIMPAIKNLMKKYPTLRFELLGSIEKGKLKTYFKGFPKNALDRIWLGAAESIFYKYPEWLGQQKWHIGIAPLVDTPFTRCKSHIKFMEYSMFKIPVVASRVYPYFMTINGKKVIEDGKTGLLARSNEWEEKLERLILDKDLRKKLGENAHKHVVDNWQYKDSKISLTIDEMLSAL